MTYPPSGNFAFNNATAQAGVVVTAAERAVADPARMRTHERICTGALLERSSANSSSDLSDRPGLLHDPLRRAAAVPRRV